MSIQLFNYSTKKYENFEPLSNEIKIYCCGPTVYDDIHIGNSRPLIVFDALACFLKNYYYNDGISVKYVRNITDIDEKIINKVKENNYDYNEFIHEQINNFYGLLNHLEVFHPINVRVSHCMDSIIDFISMLIEKKYGYISEKNNVYFDTKVCPIYGCLSGPQRENQKSISVINEEDKRHWQDFALWKTQNNEVSFSNTIHWDSPWGQGVPGWHIECSTIIKEYLGDKIDIHGGGQDLIFPHHDNEIAQCWGIHNDLFCSYWIHNGMVLVEGKKMAKSLGNFIKLKDVVHNKQDGHILKYLILSTHYSQPLNFSQDKLINSQNNVKKIKKFLENYKDIFNEDHYKTFLHQNNKEILIPLTKDFNTVEAINDIHKYIKEFKELMTMDQKEYCQKIFFKIIFLLDSLSLDFFNQ